MADRRLVFDIFARDRNTARTLDQIADAADEAGDEFDEMRRAAQRLDGEISDLQRSMRGLAVAMAATDDSSLRKDLDRQMRGLEASLRQRTKLRKLFGDAGDDSAQGFFARFAGKVGPLLASAPISPPLIAATAAAAPAIAALLSGAVTAGLGAGAVAGGVMLAARDPRVKAAAEYLGNILMDSLTADASGFVDPVLRSLDIFRSEFRGAEADIRRIFAAASQYVEPFARGLAGLAREALPGIASAVEKAGPVIDALGRELPRIGRTLGDTFNTIASGSEDAADAIEATSTALQALVISSGLAVGALTELYGDYKQMSDLGRAGLIPLLVTSDKTVGVLHRAADSIGDVGDAAGYAVEPIGLLDSEMEDLAQTAATAFNAHTRLEEAIDDATAAAKENGKTVDANTAKGRANRDALARLAAAALASRDATLAQTKSSVSANAEMQRGYNRFIAAATAMGMSKAAADRLARSLGLIPPAKNVAVYVNTRGAVSAISYLQGKIAELRGKNITVGASVRWNTGGLHVPGGTILERASGGPVGPGRDYLVGEEGPELVRFSGSGRVLSAPKTRRALAGGGTPMVVNVYAGWIATEQQLQDKLTRVLNDLQRRGRVG